MSSTREILEYHIHLCEEAWTLLNEENNILQGGGQPDSGFLQRKQDYLNRLSASTQNLQYLNDGNIPLGRDENSLIDTAQKKIMKVLMLDKENERLLQELTGKQPQTAPKEESQPATESGSDRLRSAYARTLSSFRQGQQQQKQASSEEERINTLRLKRGVFRDR